MVGFWVRGCKGLVQVTKYLHDFTMNSFHVWLKILLDFLVYCNVVFLVYILSWLQFFFKVPFIS